jgi:NADH-quinone oxidoreductase subunit G
MPKCTINGHEVEVKEGSTIIEAFKALDKDIAHYCWHPGLSVAGVCRLCMVEVEGNPRMQIACNTKVTEGMVITNQSDKVKDTVRWGLDFHLINHPLDCPICDQAGECGLQDQYMRFGQYEPQMAEKKVKKRKVVDLGERVVLDSERCILCSRCVRFTNEVSKTNELGIFNRGDRSEIGTFKDKPLNNNYSVNTVDICPVGALTSKDFRFKQRVWYLKDKKTICNGCSTGCSIDVFFNEEGVHRVRPHHNEEVNGYWMCDKGRDTYKTSQGPRRLWETYSGQAGAWKQASAQEGAQAFAGEIKSSLEADASKVGIVLTGQYTNEEYEAFIGTLKAMGAKNFFHWIDSPEKESEFDGLLFRGDRNPNTKGLREALQKAGVSGDFAQLKSMLEAGQLETLVVAGPEDISTYQQWGAALEVFNSAKKLIYLSVCLDQELVSGVKTSSLVLPMKSFVEKAGTFVNYDGKAQEFEAVTEVNEEALDLMILSSLLKGEEVAAHQAVDKNLLKRNYFVSERGQI